MRRLILTGSACVLFGVLIGQSYGSPLAMITRPEDAALIGLGAASGLALLFTVYPNAWREGLSAAGALALLLALPPIHHLALDFAEAGGQINPLEALVYLTAAWLLLSVVIEALQLHLFARVPMGQIRVEDRRRFDLPPALVKKALAPQPNETIGYRVTGPADETGLFLCGTKVLMPNPQTMAPETQIFMDSSARIVEEDTRRQVTQTILHLPGRGPSYGVVEQRFTPDGDGTIYENRELTSHFTLDALLGFWLQDAQRDYEQNLLDAVTGTPTRSLVEQSHATPITDLARLMRRAPSEQP